MVEGGIARHIFTELKKLEEEGFDIAGRAGDVLVEDAMLMHQQGKMSVNVLESFNYVLKNYGQIARQQLMGA
ncbi:MAG: hypothetical protein K0R93_3690 [Anaerosolibacter sp.]|jgi:hypothetical protein|uniref:hypothetical protein n=1 Tax=Anaerosolibacter sp. TaxID=1872527 RepID=UPI0026030C2D|nr:hypothetical protein [Anaerosolibacter sp.]MDF2548792.1 hypothetical protein [Anaerosolibacter sp.]